MTRRRFCVAIGGNETINKGGWFRGEDKYPEDINDTCDQPPSRKGVPRRCTGKNIEMDTLCTI